MKDFNEWLSDLTEEVSGAGELSPFERAVDKQMKERRTVTINKAVHSHTLTEAQMPSHNHGRERYDGRSGATQGGWRYCPRCRGTGAEVEFSIRPYRSESVRCSTLCSRCAGMGCSIEGDQV